MFKKIRNKWRLRPFSMKSKLTLSLGAIGAVLLLTSVISVLEYRRMSNYVSGLVEANIRTINVAQMLLSRTDQYNLDILTVVGDDTIGTLPDFDRGFFYSQCDSLKLSFAGTGDISPLVDSVLYSFSAYMQTSMELETVLLSDFINSRDWYFGRLQPCYNTLRSDIENLSTMAYGALQENSLTFQDSFYRSIVPVIVSVAVGLILVIMLFFFIVIYYVNPLYRMLSGLNNYSQTGARYSYDFEGDDQLSDLNLRIGDLVEENIELKRRNKMLKEREE